MENIDEKSAIIIREWLTDVMRITGMKPTPLAKKAGLAPSTILRALQDDNPTALERRSITKICATFSVQPPMLAPDPGYLSLPVDVGVADISRLDDQPLTWAGLPLTPNQYVARVGTRAVDLAGVRPGDELLFDMAATPHAADVVSAQVYSPSLGARTVLRIYDQPYLTTRSTDPDFPTKPFLVDGEWVRIAAVARLLLREFSR